MVYSAGVLCNASVGTEAVFEDVCIGGGVGGDAVAVSPRPKRRLSRGVS